MNHDFARNESRFFLPSLTLVAKSRTKLQQALMYPFHIARETRVQYLRQLCSQLRHYPFDEKITKLNSLEALLRRRYGVKYSVSGLKHTQGGPENGADADDIAVFSTFKEA